MSGHSKWHTIKHKKGAADAKRGKIFTRIIKELTVAARSGGGDIDSNPRLRTIVAEAKSVNMPADNIKRAIQRGTGELPGVSYEEINYEGYGPGGAAVIVETLTDNKNRTVGEIRHVLSKHGGNLAAENSVAWMFDKKGYIVVEKSKADEEALMAAAIDAGADDMRDDGDSWEIVSAPDAFQKVLDAVKALGHRAGRRGGRVPAAELREARRQAGPADGQADGSARRTRGHQEGLVERRYRREGDRGLVGVKIFGIDPGSERTGYGCIETRSAAVTTLSSAARSSAPARSTFPDKLKHIHAGLAALLARHRPDCVAVENIFYARNVRSALKLGHARGVALLAASEAGLPVVEYAPAEIKRAVVGLRSRGEAPGATDGQAAARAGRAPSPHDAADALAVAICHVHSATGIVAERARGREAALASWRIVARLSAMIARLRGTFVEKSPSRLIVEAGRRR